MSTVGNVTESIGKFSSTTPSSNTAHNGRILSSTMTKAFAVYADDGGVAFTAGAYRAAVERLLVATALSAGDISIYGNQAQLRVVADASAATGVLGGEWGYVELVSGGKVNIAGALVAHVDLPSGATIASGGRLAGLIIKTNDLGGTHTGKAVGIYIPNEGAGAFDAFLGISSSSAMLADTGAGGGTSKYLKVLIDDTAYSILVKSDA